MAVSINELRNGLQMVDAVLPMRDVLAQAGSSVVQTVISNKAGGDYLFYAKALDSLRSYAAGPKLIPGTNLYNHTKPLIDKMEELDGLIAQERAGVSKNIENPFVMSELIDTLDTFAFGINGAIQTRDNGFKLGSEEIDLLKSLDGMVRHLELPVRNEWQVLRNGVKKISDPVAMDDSIFDSLQSRWSFKTKNREVEEAIKTQRKDALSSVENGLAVQLASSRAAAKADAEIKKADPTAQLSSAGMLYRNFFSTCTSLKKYREKYLDQMGQADSEALQNCINNFLRVEDELAGTDTRLEETSPNLYEAQEIIELDLWPSVVNYFGSHKPNSMVIGDDAVLIRRIRELQEALCLPETVGDCDMRQVYNYVPGIDKTVAPDANVMDDAAKFWADTKQKRFDESEAGKKKIAEDQERIRQEQEKTRLEQERIRLENEQKQKEEKRLADLKKKADEEAAALKQKQLEDEKRRKEKEEADEKIRQEKLEEEEHRKQQEEALEELRKKIPDYEQAQKEKEFDYLTKEMEQMLKEKKAKLKESEPAPSQDDRPLPIPTAEDKTWKQYAEDIKAYLRQNLNDLPKFGPGTDLQRVDHYPNITQILHGLVAINRYVEAGLGDETVNMKELVQQSRQLMEDPGFKKALEDTFDNKWLLSRDYKIFWSHVMDNSRAAYQQLSKDQNKQIYSPFEIKVEDIRKIIRKNELDAEKPFRDNISNIVEQIDNVRYNKDIQKTGFLFFKPSDTGLFQTAADKLRKIARTEPDESVLHADMNEAYIAVKAYLDDRKDVRVHEYGKHRWEKMMCAFAALATKEEFANYCKELNEYRKITDPMDPDFVSPEAFGPGRMDLDDPQIPLRQARAQVLKEYKQPIPQEAGTEDKDLWYFARIAAMRNSAAVKNDWGALIDMKKVNDQAKLLVQDTGFVDLVKSEAFRKGDPAERQSLYETAAKAIAPKKDWIHPEENVREVPETQYIKTI